MMKLLTAAFAFLLLCGFGAGPFWGEGRTPAASGGGGVEILGSPSLFAESVAADTGTSTSFDATGADMLLAAACVLTDTATSSITGSTAATFNGDSMTQIAVSTSSGGTSFPDCGIWVLDSPDQGSYTLAITWDETVKASALLMMNLTGTASTQNGDTDADDSGNNQETSVVSITPTAADNLMVHFGASRGADMDPCTTTNTTENADGETGTSDFDDIAYCGGAAATVDTSPINLTLDFAGSDRVGSVAAEIVAP